MHSPKRDIYNRPMSSSVLWNIVESGEKDCKSQESGGSVVNAGVCERLCGSSHTARGLRPACQPLFKSEDQVRDRHIIFSYRENGKGEVQTSYNLK